MKAGTLVAILGKRLGIAPAGWEAYAPHHMTLGDVDSAEALATTRRGSGPTRRSSGPRARGLTDVDEDIRRALSHGQTIDITTTGRRSGLPRRIEIVFHNFDGRIYISGLPSRRKRAWLANLEADPHLTLHLKGRRVTADLPADGPRHQRRGGAAGDPVEGRRGLAPAGPRGDDRLQPAHRGDGRGPDAAA